MIYKKIDLKTKRQKEYKMPDYQKAKIYKLWSPSKNLVYYGSTVQTISQRLSKHLYKFKCYNNNDNNTNYLTSFLILECEDYKIELIEEYPCNNKHQLERKEGEYIKVNECVNKRVEGRTQKEYYIDNHDKVREKQNQYNINNADKINEQQKQYNKDNADKIKEYKKQYAIDNADKLKERQKQYRIDNADKIKEYKKQYYNRNKSLKS